MEANSDSSGLHREAARQAAQHRLNRVAFGFLAMEDHLLLHWHRFKLHTTLCKWQELMVVYLLDAVLQTCYN